MSTSALRFLHTADWQLGKPYARVSDPDKRALLRQERLAAIGRIGAVAREHGAAFVVVAGDLFDSHQPTHADLSAACSAIGALGLPVLVIPGNHDHGCLPGAGFQLPAEGVQMRKSWRVMSWRGNTPSTAATQVPYQ